MNKSCTVYILLLTAVFCFFPLSASGIGLEISGGFWGQGPSGDIQSDAVSSTDKLDIEKDLNYDEEYRPFGRIKADMPFMFPNIYLMATPMKFEERGSKNISFKFGDQTFSADVPFDSKVKIDHYDITLFYSLPLMETATLSTLNAEIGIGARIIDLEVDIIQEATGLSESESLTLPLPMVYAGVQIMPAEMLSIEGEGRGFVYSSNHYYDLIGRIKVKPFGPLFIAGGYRYESIEIDHEDVEASIDFKGPFIEAGLQF